MSITAFVDDALRQLPPRHNMSRSAIVTWIRENKITTATKIKLDDVPKLVRTALKRGLTFGRYRQSKQSFRLAATTAASPPKKKNRSKGSSPHKPKKAISKVASRKKTKVGKVAGQGKKQNSLGTLAGKKQTRKTIKRPRSALKKKTVK